MDDEKLDGGLSALTDVLSVEPLHISVRGSNGITFVEGSRTGNMVEFGVQIKTVWYDGDRTAYGGCIDRSEAKQIRDWLNLCIAKWDSENEMADNAELRGGR